MPEIASARAECYATFTFSAVTYRLATRGFTRSNASYDPVLVDPLVLTTAFSENGILMGRRFQLEIVAEPGSTYRTLVQNNSLAGTPITIEVVTTVTYTDGSTAEQAFTQVLSIGGDALRPGRVVLDVVDLEDERLNASYPTALLTADEFPKADPDGVGKPIPFPVGTALKLPGRLLAQQLAWDGTKKVAEWIYALCELEWQSYPITAVSTGAKQFTVGSDIRPQVNVGDAVWVFDPASRSNSTNAGKYTIGSISYSAPNTTITVNETIGSATVSSSINIPPRVLAVYRDGRLLTSTEYTVEVLDNLAGPVPAANSDFSNASAEWSAISSGTGMASVAAGVANLSGDGGQTNYGWVRLSAAGIGASVSVRRHQYTMQRVTVTGSGSVWMHSTSATPTPVAGNGTLIAAGAPTRALVRNANGTADLRVSFATFGTGVAASVTLDNWQIEQPAKPQLLLRFYQEQRDPGGRLYTIEADVLGYRSRNVSDEIKRLLVAAGASAGAASFGAAATIATNNVMLVDCDYGARGQRKFRAILEDLLFFARGALVRGSTGDYDIVQDTSASNVGTLDELQGDLIEVQGVQRPPRVLSKAVQYRPSARNPNELQHTITRTVSGGILGAESPRPLPYVRDHEAADRFLCYLANRAAANGKMSGRVLLARPALGVVYTISSAPTYASTKDWFLWNLRHELNGVTFDALEYSSAVHTYTPNPYPADADPGYTPDYSQTPPAAPTALKITAAAAVIANDGDTTARITCECVPPAVNWAELWFVAIHNVTSEVTPVRGDYDAANNKVTSNIGGLRPGEVYKLTAYAVNGFGVLGTVQGTFDATAIGGGGAVTTFTTPGVTAVPSNVASCSASQGMGRIVNVSWPVVSANNLWGYVLERDAGGGYSEVFRGQATSYRDTGVSIGTAYTYRVKARDTYGNVSASYATSGSVNPSGNIQGGTSGNDIGSSTVATGNRTGITTISAAWANLGGSTVAVAISHSLGKVPVLGGVQTGSASASVATSAVSSSSITFRAFLVPDLATTSVAPNNPHSHNHTWPNTSGTFSADLW